MPNRGGIPIDAYGKNPVSGDNSSPVSTQPVVTPAQEEQKAADNQIPVQTPPAPQPAGGPRSKEQEPTPQPFPDVTKMSEADIKKEEVEVEKELESWIEKLPHEEKPQIPEEAKKLGLEHAKEDTPMPTSPTGVVALPMTYEQAEDIRKKTRFQLYYWRKSITWLASLIMYHWKRIKITATVTDNKKE
jgi:hypothetical protein